MRFKIYFVASLPPSQLNVSTTETHTHTHTQMDAHAWGLTCSFCTHALGHTPTSGPNRPPPAAHRNTHTNPLLGATTEPPIHNFCARHLLCPRVSVLSVPLSFTHIKRDIREVNTTPSSAAGEGDKALFNWKRGGGWSGWGPLVKHAEESLCVSLIQSSCKAFFVVFVCFYIALYLQYKLKDVQKDGGLRGAPKTTGGARAFVCSEVVKFSR